MKSFTLEAVKATQEQSGRRYEEFLHVPAMSAGCCVNSPFQYSFVWHFHAGVVNEVHVGLYVLPAGAVDGQKPHTEDELYYVLQGRARMQMGTEDVAVKAGSFVFVEAGVAHRFHSITEDLSVLVFFAPAEGITPGVAG